MDSELPIAGDAPEMKVELTDDERERLLLGFVILRLRRKWLQESREEDPVGISPEDMPSTRFSED